MSEAVDAQEETVKILIEQAHAAVNMEGRLNLVKESEDPILTKTLSRWLGFEKENYARIILTKSHLPHYDRFLSTIRKLTKYQFSFAHVGKSIMMKMGDKVAKIYKREDGMTILTMSSAPKNE